MENDTYDPFMCEDCQQLGFCKKMFQEQFLTVQHIGEEYFDSQIVGLEDKKCYGANSGAKQKAPTIFTS